MGQNYERLLSTLEVCRKILKERGHNNNWIITMKNYKWIHPTSHPPLTLIFFCSMFWHSFVSTNFSKTSFVAYIICQNMYNHIYIHLKYVTVCQETKWYRVINYLKMSNIEGNLCSGLTANEKMLRWR